MKTFTLKEVTANNSGVDCSTREPLIGKINVTDDSVAWLVSDADARGTDLEGYGHGCYPYNDNGDYGELPTTLMGYIFNDHTDVWEISPYVDMAYIIDGSWLYITKSPVIAFCERCYPHGDGYGDLEDSSGYDGGVITYAPRPMDGFLDDEEDEQLNL